MQVHQSHVHVVSISVLYTIALLNRVIFYASFIIRFIVFPDWHKICSRVLAPGPSEPFAISEPSNPLNGV